MLVRFHDTKEDTKSMKNISALIPSSVESISSNCFNYSLNLKEIIIHKKKGEITGSPWGCVYGDRGVTWDE